MLTFAVPAVINGAGLAAELRAAGVTVTDWQVSVAAAELRIDAPDTAQATVAAVVAAHTGTPTVAMQNQTAILTQLQTAVTYFGGNYTNWPTLTNPQKDTAARNAQRALGQIARWLLGQFDATG